MAYYRGKNFIFRLLNDKEPQTDFTIWSGWVNKTDPEFAGMRFPIRNGVLISSIDNQRYDVLNVLQYMTVSDFKRLFPKLQRNYKRVRDTEVDGTAYQFAFPNSVEKKLAIMIQVLKSEHKDVMQTYMKLNYYGDKKFEEMYMLEIVPKPEVLKSPQPTQPIAETPKPVSSPKPLFVDLKGQDKSVPHALILIEEEEKLYDAIAALGIPLSNTEMLNWERWLVTWEEKGFKNVQRIEQIWNKYKNDVNVPK